MRERSGTTIVNMSPGTPLGLRTLRTIRMPSASVGGINIEMTISIRAVLWDLDGTLIDSEEYHWQAWRDTMAAAGRPITHAEFLTTFGWRNDAILPLWLGEHATPAEIERLGDAKEEHYRALVRAGGLMPLPGVAEWIERLHREGWREAIATSAPRANLDCVLEVLRLGAAFDALIGAEDVTHGKPAPDVFLTAAAKVGADPRNCVVVEDADAGIEAGKRAGMRTIGISRNGKARAADIVVPSLTELPEDAFRRLLHS
jgi:HAD superfamily hydrolase (TIGR01509 family)